MIQPLQPPNSLHLQIAEGWVGLSDYAAASDELDQITTANRAHPDVLQLRWRIYADSLKWDSCLDIATALTTTAPKRPSGWIHRAQSFHQLGRTQEAKDLLLSVINDFESNATIPYHLARYFCGLGQVEEAMQFLGKALLVAADTDEVERLHKLAMEDPDLEPLRRMS